MQCEQIDENIGRKFSRSIPYLCGMAKRFRDQRLFMIFTAFFDESAKQPEQGKALIMGGFIGHVDEWDSASEAWDECLRESPSIDYFSRKEATGLNGQFDRWKRGTADEKVKSLAEVVAKFRLQGFCVTVPHAWFTERDVKSIRGMVATRAYDWGFLTATSGVLQHMGKLTVEYIVDFVFDKCGELRACIDLYDEMKASGLIENMAHAGGCFPGDDKRIAALQMADLLAGEFAQFSEDGMRQYGALSTIVTAKPVIHIPCNPPPQIADTLAVQKLGAEIQRAAQLLCKRIYKDREKSLELVNDVIELKKQEAFFWLEFRRLCEMYGEDWKPFMEEFHRAVANSKNNALS